MIALTQSPKLYVDKKVQWTEIRGSDTHSFSDNRFGTFTWIKMDTPSIDGLELALRDGAASVNRNMTDNPNRYAECLIEALEIDKAKYIGRSKPLNFRFSPFLNTIIGGRGSGKSTLLEFIRFTLRRHGELPEPLKEERHQYFNIGGNNLLIEDSKISLIYRKGAALSFKPGRWCRLPCFGARKKGWQLDTLPRGDHVSVSSPHL